MFYKVEEANDILCLVCVDVVGRVGLRESVPALTACVGLSVSVCGALGPSWFGEQTSVNVYKDTPRSGEGRLGFDVALFLLPGSSWQRSNGLPHGFRACHGGNRVIRGEPKDPKVTLENILRSLLRRQRVHTTQVSVFFSLYPVSHTETYPFSRKHQNI